MNIIVSYPKLVPFGIGFAITIVIGIAIEMLDHTQTAEAVNQNNQGSSAHPATDLEDSLFFDILNEDIIIFLIISF